ncbi:MAG: TolC family protein, partial [Elusimicrobia bacterium]|nr:TolC family protein [Elusimicrobiota bacterium]
RLDYPIFTGGQTSAKIAQARSQRDQARAEMEKAERFVRLEIKRQWLSVLEAAERARSQESAIGQARRALEAVEIRYRAGEASLLDQNDATLALQRARLQFATALHDYRVSLAALERAAGTRPEENAR